MGRGQGRLPFVLPFPQAPGHGQQEVPARKVLLGEAGGVVPAAEEWGVEGRGEGPASGQQGNILTEADGGWQGALVCARVRAAPSRG